MNWQLTFTIAQALGLPALFLYYLKDRRKNRAETVLAESTVKDKIDLSSVTSVDAHVGLIQKAFEAERSSMSRHIDDLEERLAASEARLAASEAREQQKTAELATMRAELERLRAQVDTLSDELQAASLRIQALIADQDS